MLQYAPKINNQSQRFHLLNEFYDYRLSAVKKHSGILSKSARDNNKSIQINYNGSVLPSTQDFEFNLVTPLKDKDVRYPFFNSMIDHDGTFDITSSGKLVPDQSEGNVPYLAYRALGKKTIASAYDGKEVNILAYLNVNKNDVQFEWNDQK